MLSTMSIEAVFGYINEIGYEGGHLGDEEYLYEDYCEVNPHMNAKERNPPGF